MELLWFGQSGFKLSLAGKIIYIDPYDLSGELSPADYVLITHAHYDHCDPDSINRIAEDDTPILAPQAAADKIAGNVSIIQEGDTLDLAGLKVKAVAAYNTNKPNHPRGSGVGYVITAGSESIYHAGDTDVIPEMQAMGNITVALLPVGGTYTMTADEAVCAVELIHPRIAIPMHYGAVVGSSEDAKVFIKRVTEETDTQSVIAEKGYEIEL